MPSFAIEVPGETSPLTQDSLVQTLTAAASRDQTQVQAGTKQLQAWETKPGYHALLQDAFLHKPFPKELRMLALIQLKNGVDKYWRRAATNQMSTEERDKIRSRLLESIVLEETPQLASLEAVVAAKIARVDFPTTWPNLVTDLTNILRTAFQPSATPTQLSRTLTLGLHIIKELSSVRLARPKGALQESAPELFQVLSQAYQARTAAWEQFLAGNASPDDNVIRSMDSTEQILKILRRLIMAGFDKLHHKPEIVAFWDFSAAQTNRLVQLLGHVRSTPYFMLVGLHLTQLAKFHVHMADDHPSSFGLFPTTPDLVLMYWSAAKPMRQQHFSPVSDDDEEYSSVYESFCLRTLLLFRSCFRIAYNTGGGLRFNSVKNDDEGKAAREALKTRVMREDIVSDLFGSLLHQFFLYAPADLEEWQEEPEEWQFKEEGDEDAFDRSVRPCAERLFLDIVLQFKDSIMTPLLEFCGRLPTISHALEKEAVLSAVGAASAMLHDRFDFSAFLKDIIIPELQKEEQFAFVIRRRIAILLAEWGTTEINDEAKTLTYQIYQHLLDPDVAANDRAVRITAAKRLLGIVTAWGFSPRLFSSFATPILSRLIALVSEVDMPESKMAILNTLSAVIEGMDLDVGPFADQIVSLLPPLWEESGSEHLMKQAIVHVLVKLVASLKAQSTPLHNLVIPIIKGALEPGSQTQVYLLEDSLELLYEIASQSPEATPQLLELAPLVLPVLEMGTEVVEKALEIVNVYILLSAEYMLQDDMRRPFFKSATALLTSKRSVIIDMTTKNVEMLIQSAGRLHQEAGVQAIASDLYSAGLIDRALSSLLANWSAKQTTGPNKQDLSPDWRNETNYFCLLSRVVLGNAGSFLDALRTWAQTKNQEWITAFQNLLDEWFGHMDSVGNPSKSKLMCMALTKLAESGEPMMLAKLQDLMAMWTSMVIELREDESNSNSDGMVRKETELSLGADESVPVKVLSAFSANDPVYCVPLPGYIKHCLDTAIAKSGGQQVFQQEWLVNVDREVVAAFGELGIM